MIHPLAYIHPNAEIGNNVTIEPFAYIDDNVTIGDGTTIYSNAVVRWGSRIGKNCAIHSGAVVGGIPQDLKFVGEETTVEIGDNTMIREFATVNRGTKAKWKTVIGSNTLIMAYVHIAHDCIIGNNVILGNTVQAAGEVEIDDFAIVSGGTLIHQFSRIGAHVMVQGGSKINKDIPPYITAGREPISYAGLNLVGLRRRGFSAEKIEEIHEVYRRIYLNGMNVSDALTSIEQEMPESDEITQIIQFIRNSPRGIIRG